MSKKRKAEHDPNVVYGEDDHDSDDTGTNNPLTFYLDRKEETNIQQTVTSDQMEFHLFEQSTIIDLWNAVFNANPNLVRHDYARIQFHGSCSPSYYCHESLKEVQKSKGNRFILKRIPEDHKKIPLDMNAGIKWWAHLGDQKTLVDLFPKVINQNDHQTNCYCDDRNQTIGPLYVPIHTQFRIEIQDLKDSTQLDFSTMTSDAISIRKIEWKMKFHAEPEYVRDHITQINRMNLTTDAFDRWKNWMDQWYVEEGFNTVKFMEEQNLYKQFTVSFEQFGRAITVSPSWEQGYWDDGDYILDFNASAFKVKNDEDVVDYSDTAIHFTVGRHHPNKTLQAIQSTNFFIPEISRIILDYIHNPKLKVIYAPDMYC